MTQYDPYPVPPNYAGTPIPPSGLGFPPPPPKRRLSLWMWALIVAGGLVALSCAGGLAFIMYVGAVGPDTKVLVGNEVPARFITTARNVGVLEPDEQVRFFYSDALTDIQEGFYLCSDKKVAIYMKSAAVPATIVPFEEIDDVTFVGSTTWIEDSTVTLHLSDGSVVSFPVSSEGGRDKLVHQHIMKAIAANDPPSADGLPQVEPE